MLGAYSAEMFRESGANHPNQCTRPNVLAKTTESSRSRSQLLARSSPRGNSGFPISSKARCVLSTRRCWKESISKSGVVFLSGAKRKYVAITTLTNPVGRRNHRKGATGWVYIDNGAGKSQITKASIAKINAATNINTSQPFIVGKLLPLHVLSSVFCARFHSFSRLSISAFGISLMARNRLSSLLKGGSRYLDRSEYGSHRFPIVIQSQRSESTR